MKIAFSAIGRALDSGIDPRFGRCAYFIIVNLDDMSFEALENESGSLGGGAGIQSAQFIASKGVSVVITGNVGPNAMRTLEAAGIEVIIGVSGSVKDAIVSFQGGKFSPANQANVPGHYGKGSGQTPYLGAGMDRGIGVREGYDPDQGISAASSDQELRALKDEAKSLSVRLNSILSRIEDLEKK